MSSASICSSIPESSFEAIRDRDSLYEAFVEATNSGYALLDERGFVIDANDEFLRLTDRKSREETVGHCVTDWTAPHDRDRHAREIATCLETGSLRDLEVDCIALDGSTRVVQINGRTQHIAGAARIVTFSRDISARCQREADRRATDRRLHEKQKLESLGVLAGGIAHDFNNLLTGILGHATLVSAQAGPHSPLLAGLEQIETAAMRGGDLCHQMLAYAGKGRFLMRPIDLNAVIEETTNLLRISIKKTASLHSCLATELPPVLADAAQMRQIIMNLVINASEAITEPNGHIIISTSLVHVDKAGLTETWCAPDVADGAFVLLDVSDDGAGMSAEVKTRIFDPFFTTKFTGRGLGLAAVLGIVRGHRGALQVESEPAMGATFRVLLPVAAGAMQPAPPRVLDSERWQSSGKVLVIDDEEAVRTTTAGLLELLGFTPLIESGGRAGARTFAEARDEIRVVLLDVTMPHFDGEETLRELRRIKPDACVILMSGFTEEEVARRFAGKEPTAFLPKPFRLSTLRDTLKQVLA